MRLLTRVVDFSHFQKAIPLLLVIKDKFVRLTCKMYGQPALNFPNTKSSIFCSCLPLQKHNLLYIMLLSKKPFGVKWGSLCMWCKQFLGSKHLCEKYRQSFFRGYLSKMNIPYIVHRFFVISYSHVMYVLPFVRTYECASHWEFLSEIWYWILL
jgi:hypothetical protein